MTIPPCNRRNSLRWFDSLVERAWLDFFTSLFPTNPDTNNHTTLTLISRSFGCYPQKKPPVLGEGSVEVRPQQGRAATFFSGRLAVPSVGRAQVRPTFFSGTVSGSR